LIPVVRKGLQVMAVSESQHMSSRVNWYNTNTF
jgi:hypothetical protein